MPDARPTGEVGGIWRRFVAAIGEILPGLPAHRPLDQFRDAQESAVRYAGLDHVVDDIERAYHNTVIQSNENTQLAAAAEIVVLEMKAVPLALGVHQDEAKAGTSKPGALKAIGKAASTVLGSMLDLFTLTPLGKGAAVTLREALDIANAE